MAEEKGTQQGGLISGFLSGSAMGVVAGILMSKPAAAAPPEQKMDYLIELLEALLQGNAAIIEWLQKIHAAQGVPGEPGVEVTVRTKWEATEPEEVFSQAVLAAGTYHTDRMVDFRQNKRLYFFVQNTLDQPVQCQVIGNLTDNKDGATDIGPAKICPANDNISLAPTWEQWLSYVGVRMVIDVAPTSGLLTVTVVRQE